MIVSVDGRLRDAMHGGVSPFDHGLTTGDGVFETMRVYNGVPFAWTLHRRRLERSAAALGIAVPSDASIRDAADAVLRANSLLEARLRVTVTAGPAPLGSAKGDAPPTVVVAASAIDPPADASSIVTLPWTRNERSALAGVKATSYGENVRGLAWAKERDADEGIFGNTRDELCEGTGTNVFLVEGSRIRTPPLESGCLDGVTRRIAIALSRSLGFEVVEEAMPLSILESSGEAFLTSSTREIQAIGRIDGRPLGRGEATAEIAKAYVELVARDPDPIFATRR